MSKKTKVKVVIVLENPELAAAMAEIRRSNAAVPHRNKKKYNRKRKHRKEDY